MSTAPNKAVYRRWFEEVVSGGDLALADELLAADYRLHFPALPIAEAWAAYDALGLVRQLS